MLLLGLYQICHRHDCTFSVQYKPELKMCFLNIVPHENSLKVR